MKRKLTAVIVVALLLVLATYYLVAMAAGGADDPVISLSYLNSIFKPQVMSEVGAEVEKKVDEAKPGIISDVTNAVKSSGVTGSSEFVAVELKNGKTVRPNGGSLEVLLRRGSFVCVDPAGSDGITNMTAGAEAVSGEQLVLQNLYLIPRDDGRAITALTDSWIMVRGAYAIE